MTLEEVQAMLLAEQEKNETLTNEVLSYKTKLSTQEEKTNTIKQDLENARELNSKLALKISTQTLTPKEVKVETPKEKSLSFDDILKEL